MSQATVAPEIRPATKNDMKRIYELIKELAVFEQLEQQVRITEKILIEDGFETDKPAFECFVAEVNKTIIGYALYYESYSTWLGRSMFLEDLYVQNEYRNKGIGKLLFMEVAKIAYTLPSKRLDFHVLNWNPAKKFYGTLGAVNLSKGESWELYRLNEDGLHKLLIY